MERRLYLVRHDDGIDMVAFRELDDIHEFVRIAKEQVQMGIDSVAIDARGRTQAYAEEMVHIYRHAIREVQRDINGAKDRLIPLKKQAEEMALGGITGSHFIKGLKKSHIP